MKDFTLKDLLPYLSFDYFDIFTFTNVSENEPPIELFKGLKEKIPANLLDRKVRFISAYIPRSKSTSYKYYRKITGEICVC